MRILFTIIFIHFIAVAYSQNWSVFNKDYRYNYSLENESYTTVVIFADSVLKQGADTIYSLNRIAAKCDSCFFYYPEPGVADSDYVTINQPQFMQRRIVYSNYQYRFSDTSDYIIPRFLSVGNLWTFNVACGITAQVINATLKDYFGVSDSVNTILLSTNDTIIISKQFGIIKYPAKFGQQTYYKLRGIESDSVYDMQSLYGEKVPNYYDFFKLKAGVIHYYSTQVQYFGIGVGNHCDQYGYGKKTILSSILSGTNITNTLNDEFKGCYTNCGFTCLFNPAFFPSTYGSTTYSIINQPANPINFYNDDDFNFYNNKFYTPANGSSPYFYIIKFGMSSNNHFFKTYGNSCFGSNIQSVPVVNPLYSLFYEQSNQNQNVFYSKQDFNNTFSSFGQTYIEGYGQVNAFFPAFESINYYCTSAIIDGLDTLGTMDVTNITTSNKKIENNSYSSFGPNPTKDIITINFPFESTGNNSTIEVKDVFGKILFQKTITVGSNSEKINLQNFSQGTYFIEVKVPHFQKQYKVIKE